MLSPFYALVMAILPEQQNDGFEIIVQDHFCTKKLTIFEA